MIQNANLCMHVCHIFGSCSHIWTARLARELLSTLVQRAGRIVLNGMLTGVAVCDAMHHGGPWPAASDASFTSVGTGAIRRFLRPVALQGLPEHLLAAVVSS